MRAILLASMAEGTSHVQGALESPDVAAMVVACRQLGAKITHEGDVFTIVGVAGKPQTPLDAVDSGNSGQVLRFIAALAALSDGTTEVTGDASVQTLRPVTPLLEGLAGLGAKAVSVHGNGCAPIHVTGPLHAGTTRLIGQDSQPVSALLMAAPFLDGTTDIYVDDPGETPWIELTLDWLNKLGVAYERNDSYTHYKITGPVRYPGFDYRVPGDFSSVAYPIVAALLTNSEVTLDNVDLTDVQGDKKLIEILKRMGANFTYDAHKHALQVHAGSPLQGCRIDLNEVIDAITLMAVVGCFAEGETVLYNAAIARNKECDRIASIATELKKMGADIEERPDGLVIRKSVLKPATVETYHDHRMVMSLSVAAMATEGATTVLGSACVAKSYPVFAQQMQDLGANIETFEVPA